MWLQHAGLARALRILSHDCAPLHFDGTPKKTQIRYPNTPLVQYSHVPTRTYRL